MEIVSKKNYSRIIILLMFVSTAIQAIAGFAKDASTGFKLILCFLCWASVFLCVIQRKYANQSLGNLKIVYVSVQLLIVLSVLNSLLFGVVYSGNKYLVLFGNMYAALNIVCFFFISSILAPRDMVFLRNITIAYTFMSVVLLFFNYAVTIDSYFLIYPLTYAMLFIPYVRPKHKVLIGTGMALSYFAFIGGGRQAVLFWAFNVIAVISYKWASKRIVYIGSIIVLILPWILLWYSIYVGESIFEILSNSMSSTDDELNVDTRTFLFMETYDDLSAKSLLSVLFGRGALAYYDSPFFSTFNRFGIEIPILEWMLQAGLLYVILFTVVCVMAVVKLYRNGNNKFCKIASVLIVSYYFNCFVSNLNGCNLSIMAFWFMIYLSNNRKMCGMADTEWEKILG